MPSQRLIGAAVEGGAAEVFQRAALRVLVPVREVSGVPRGGAGGGGHLLLRRDPDVDLCVADAADPLHHPRMSQRRVWTRDSDAPRVQEIKCVCVFCVFSLT